ncbi:ZIP family metal transporter [Candidatus Microgenomates bacterium]|nr:ZIP family metal transporter [Candidatus Microgenomates bacterium]
MTDIINITLLALLGSVIALLGGIVFLYNKKLSAVLEKYSVSFAAGVLVTVSLIGLLPEAVHILGENAFWVMTITFLSVFLFEHVFFGIHHHDDEHHVRGKEFSTFFVIVGDTIHNFIDGIAIAVTYFVSPGLGFVTALSTFLHEVPHEIADFGILLKSGWSKKRIIIINLISASMTIVGALLVYFYNDNTILNGTLMAVSAGIFLYLGASDFLPKIETEGKNKFKSILPLVLGVVAMMLTFKLIPHGH